jgi:predicted nucleic acid-binding protein
LKKVVSNATPIISLASVDKLSILKDIFKKIYIPKAVYSEIQTGQYPGHKDLDKDFFEIMEVENKTNLDFLLNDLDQGKAESIIIAKEIGADTLIIDERLAYKIANSQGL